MAETKIVKAKCSKTGRYYALEVRKYGSVWKVVNMTDMSDAEGAVVSSEVEQASFETNSNLVPCRKCGNRKIGGCGCSPRNHSCSKNMGYTFDCVYCNQLKIDYSLPTRPAGASTGGTVKLAQGQVVEIRYADNRPLSRIEVGVGWDPAGQGSEIDVDTSVALTSGNRPVDLVYYGEMEHSSGCVKLYGDNRTGKASDSYGNDDENLSVFLNKVPGNLDTLYFILNVYHAKERGQDLGRIKNLYIRLRDPEGGKNLLEYRVEGNYNGYNAIVIGKAFRNSGTWMFKAIGRSYNTDNIGEVVKLARAAEGSAPAGGTSSQGGSGRTNPFKGFFGGGQ